MANTSAPPPTTPSETLSTNVAHYRARRGWSQQELADRLSSYGMSVNRTAVTKIESGTRQVTVDELVALAAALGLSPLALVVPTAETQVRIAPHLTTSSTVSYRWMTGHLPIGGTKQHEQQTDENIRFYDEATPDGMAATERLLPGVRRLASKAAALQFVGGNPDIARKVKLAYAIRQLDGLLADVSELRDRARRDLKAESEDHAGNQAS